MYLNIVDILNIRVKKGKNLKENEVSPLDKSESQLEIKANIDVINF